MQAVTPDQPADQPEPMDEGRVSALVQDRLSPVALLQAVLSAREAVARQRRLPRGAAETAARAALLRSLVAYVSCLEHRRLPVPYRIRDELRLQQLVSRGSPSAATAPAR